MNEKGKELLTQCRNTRDTMAHKALRALIEDQVERWKEDLILASPDQAPHYQGAIQKVRQLLNKIDRDPREESQGDGGYR